MIGAVHVYQTQCFHFFRICRRDSFSNSEISLEQKSADDAVKDICTDSSSSSISHASPSPSLFPNGRLTNPPFSAPCASIALPSSSSSPILPGTKSVFKFDKPYPSVPFEATGDGLTPPPLPPKPNHLPEQHLSDEGAHMQRAMSVRHFSSSAALFPRRTSLSSLDHFRIGTFSKWKHYHSINTTASDTHQK